MKPLYTVHELADTLRLQPGTIRNKLSRGEDLPRSILVGRRRLFPEDEVETWLRAQEARQTGRSPVDSPIHQPPIRPSKGIGKPRHLSSAPAASPRGSGRKPSTNKHRKHLSAAQIALFD
jgi:excisionase family DNA binding protein